MSSHLCRRVALLLVEEDDTTDQVLCYWCLQISFLCSMNPQVIDLDYCIHELHTALQHGEIPAPLVKKGCVFSNLSGLIVHCDFSHGFQCCWSVVSWYNKGQLGSDVHVGLTGNYVYLWSPTCIIYLCFLGQSYRSAMVLQGSITRSLEHMKSNNLGSNTQRYQSSCIKIIHMLINAGKRVLTTKLQTKW